jgi:2,3-bisphosphoglycerate-independent phosphoglycerate mutase
MAKKALLMILDGWGIGQLGKGDVIYNTPTPYLDLFLTSSLFAPSNSVY